jgi:hypothetical protein
MKKYLRRITGAAIALIAFAIGANAQETRSADEIFVRDHAFKMLKMNLEESDISGIVEQTLYAVLECKNRYPELDYSQLLKAVDNVARENDNLSIEYKASLASMFLSHGSDIHITPISGADRYEYLFKQIADQLEQKLLVLQNEQTVTENK